MPLSAREFLSIVADTALAQPPGRECQARVRWSLLQLYFDSPAQHYELWLRRRDGLVELGLHFEGPREENYRRLEWLAGAMPEVLEGLGPGVELEEWTESWTRLHEVRPLPTLDEPLAAELGRRLARYVEVLEPILEPLGPMPLRQPQRRRTPRS